MGKRGPGAVAIDLEAIKRQRPASWDHPRLSRSAAVIKFIEALPITSGFGAGGKMQLAPFQRGIVQSIYGTPGVRTALITLPRKQGKSTLAAALVLNHLVGPGTEQRGQLFSAACDRMQAALIFDEVCAMLDQRPALRARCNIQQWMKMITDAKSGSVYRALSADARKAHGLGPSTIVCDELAQWKRRELYDNLTSGTGGRKAPLTIVISTRSADPHHVMTELVDYGQKVLDGVLEDRTFVPIIYAAPADADWLDEATWRRCNPAIDAGFRSLEEMRVAAQQAQRMPAREPVFRNLYLNQAVDASSDRFIPLAEWQACRGEVDPEALRGRPCWGGLDLSSTSDLTSLCLFFPEDGGRILSWFWVPRERLQEREQRDHVPYLTWEAQGLLAAPAGRAIDRRAIARTLAEVTAAYDVRGIAYDRWRIEDLNHVLNDEGISINLEAFGQGYQSFGPAIDALESVILNRQLVHGGHPILTWNVSNALVTMDPAGARKFDKKRAVEKIDGLVALCMAVGLHAKAPPVQTYDFSDEMVIAV
jgi:phage terminase large subunit-like protein